MLDTHIFYQLCSMVYRYDSPVLDRIFRFVKHNHC